MPPTPPYLKSILEEHFEELQMLSQMQQRALRDPARRARNLRELDERIAAHLDGLVLGAEHSVPILVAGLGGDDRSAAFAAAYVLLHMEHRDLRPAVMAALAQAKEGQLAGIAEALSRSSVDGIAEELSRLAEAAPAPVAAAALEALLQNGGRGVKTPRLAEFVRHEDPAVRCAGWRIFAMSEAQN